MHSYLVDLMRKFELCFPFAEDDSRYLVPSMLGAMQPDLGGRFQHEQCLNFQYHYQALPESLLPRFIVRTHALSKGQPRWRTGVVLAYENNGALVKADRAVSKVFVAIDGPAAGRRGLLAVVRSEFDRIHRDSLESPRP